MQSIDSYNIYAVIFYFGVRHIRTAILNFEFFTSHSDSAMQKPFECLFLKQLG